jgi:hypothetical protein
MRADALSVGDAILATLTACVAFVMFWFWWIERKQRR